MSAEYLILFGSHTISFAWQRIKYSALYFIYKFLFTNSRNFVKLYTSMYHRGSIMSRMYLDSAQKGQDTIDALYAKLANRLAANPNGLCPVESVQAFLRLAHSQSCGKCVPCLRRWTQ